MNFEKLYLILNKRGLFNTFQILSQCEDNKAEKGLFYKRLTEFSHYNSFLRIKSKLLETNLIYLEENNGKEYIGLTEKGIFVFEKLLQINELIEEAV